MRRMKHLRGKINPKYITYMDGAAFAPLNIVSGIFDLDIIRTTAYVEGLISANEKIFSQFFLVLENKWYVNWIGALIISLLRDGKPYINRRENLISSLLFSKSGAFSFLESEVQRALREIGKLSGFNMDACKILENAFFIGYYGLKREEVVDLACNVFKMKNIEEVFPYFLPIKTTTKMYHFYLEGIEFLTKRFREYNSPATESEFFNICYDLARSMRNLHCEWFPDEAPEIKYI